MVYIFSLIVYWTSSCFVCIHMTVFMLILWHYSVIKYFCNHIFAVQRLNFWVLKVLGVDFLVIPNLFLAWLINPIYLALFHFCILFTCTQLFTFLNSGIYEGHFRSIETFAVTFYKIYLLSKYLANLLLVMLTVLVERNNTVNNIEHILDVAIVTM